MNQEGHGKVASGKARNIWKRNKGKSQSTAKSFTFRNIQCKTFVEKSLTTHRQQESQSRMQIMRLSKEPLWQKDFGPQQILKCGAGVLTNSRVVFGPSNNPFDTARYCP
jgi:hypothetical protein